MKIRVFCTNPACKYMGRTYNDDEPSDKWCPECGWPVSYKCPHCMGYLKIPSKEKLCPRCRGSLQMGYAYLHVHGMHALFVNESEDYESVLPEKFQNAVSEIFAPYSNQLFDFWKEMGAAGIRSILDWARSVGCEDEFFALDGEEGPLEPATPEPASVISLESARKQKSTS